jgi:hypothetical protein
VIVSLRYEFMIITTLFMQKHVQLMHFFCWVGCLSLLHSEMAPYYEALCVSDGIIVEEERVALWRKSNQEKLESLEKAIKDAEENLGETEIRETNLKKSIYFHEIGDKVRSLSRVLIT